MNTKITRSTILKNVKFAIKKGLLPNGFESAIFFDLDKIAENIRDITNAFPKRATHAIAVKTNPLLNILKNNISSDVGCEAASIEELELALQAGYSPQAIMFNSPVKTMDELMCSLELGAHINIDNLSELNRIKGLIENNSLSQPSIGLRVNPQIGTGTIKSMSAGGTASKFGLLLNEHKEAIFEAFRNNTWLNCLHVHSGSQGLSLEKMSEGVKVVYELAVEINNKIGMNRITKIDIGGGLPIAYHENESTPQISEYVAILKEKCPTLFKKFEIITEFGRYVYGHTGFTISKVEYIKESANKNVVLTHVGADLFLRECYNPNDWYHEVSALSKALSPEVNSNIQEYTIGGPLCFDGDILRKDIALPVLEEGDYIIIHDTGANCLNLWSRHCSRRIPKVIGYSNASNNIFELKQEESIDDIIRFWS